MTNLNRVEKQRHQSADTGLYRQGYGLPRGHVWLWLWELDCKKGRAPKNWCLQTVMLEKTPESPLDSKDIKSVKLKGNQPWTLYGRTDTEAEASVFWLPDANSWLISNVSDAGKYWTTSSMSSILPVPQRKGMPACEAKSNERESVTEKVEWIVPLGDSSLDTQP